MVHQVSEAPGPLSCDDEMNSIKLGCHKGRRRVYQAQCTAVLPMKSALRWLLFEAESHLQLAPAKFVCDITCPTLSESPGPPPQFEGHRNPAATTAPVDQQGRIQYPAEKRISGSTELGGAPPSSAGPHCFGGGEGRAFLPIGSPPLGIFPSLQVDANEETRPLPGFLST